jgi:hypothetical protein
LQEWLDFLAKAHWKQPEEIESVKTTELIEAYHVTEIDSWNEKIKLTIENNKENEIISLTMLREKNSKLEKVKR